MTDAQAEKLCKLLKALITAMGMQAENIHSSVGGFPLAYGEASFRALLEPEKKDGADGSS